MSARWRTRARRGCLASWQSRWVWRGWRRQQQQQQTTTLTATTTTLARPDSLSPPQQQALAGRSGHHARPAAPSARAPLRSRAFARVAVAAAAADHDAAPPGASSETRVIVVTSGKGGVGKTTSTANLGMSIAR